MLSVCGCFYVEETANAEIRGCFWTKEEGRFENKTVIWTDFLYVTENLGGGRLSKIRLKFLPVTVADLTKESVGIQSI